MDETTISQVNPQGMLSSSSPGSGWKKFILPVVAVLIVLGLIVGGVNFFASRNEPIPAPSPFPTPLPTAIPTPTPEALPTPTSKPKATPTKKPTTEATSSATASKGLSLRVLNGSGLTGRAGAAADFLKELGYAITSTGNADNFDYDKATITIKKDKEAKLATLKTDLATKYSVGTTSATLAASESYDALVIVGKQ